MDDRVVELIAWAAACRRCGVDGHAYERRDITVEKLRAWAEANPPPS